MWKINAKAIPVVIGALGAVTLTVTVALACRQGDNNSVMQSLMNLSVCIIIETEKSIAFLFNKR